VEVTALGSLIYNVTVFEYLVHAFTAYSTNQLGTVNFVFI